jgi:nucleotide-binding universal stress UspA family protein
MFKKILAAVDGTPGGVKVLELAVRTADETTHVHVIFVLSLEFYAPDQASQNASPASYVELLKAEEVVKKACRYIHGWNLKCTASVIPGEPERAIGNYAHEKDCNLIIMGHHHMSSFDRLVGNSVAYELLQSSPCPVLIAVEHHDD